MDIEQSLLQNKALIFYFLSSGQLHFQNWISKQELVRIFVLNLRLIRISNKCYINKDKYASKLQRLGEKQSILLYCSIKANRAI